MDIIGIEKRENWCIMIPTYNGSARVTILIAVVWISCFGYHFYQSRQSRLEQIPEAAPPADNLNNNGAPKGQEENN